MDSLKMSKKKFTTTLDQVLIKEVKKLAIDLGLSANELIEEGIQLVLKKYRRKSSRKKNLKAMISSKRASFAEQEILKQPRI
jgi:metal-responsive CopG/Arc/MetJ family transcriptional regulator